MNRHVLITGASRGIGEAIAQTFIDQGDNVVALSRSGTAPEGCKLSLAVDVANSEQITSAFKQATELFGAPEVCVINAGITRDGLSMRMSDEQWREVMATDLDGAFYTARSAVAAMMRAKKGSIIIIGSISPFIGNPGQANYAAAKAGLVGMARSMAKEVASRAITINVVAPGLIETDMTTDLGDAKDALGSLIPMGRIGQPADVAGVVSFLASEHSRYITGAVIPVDGGMAMGY